LILLVRAVVFMHETSSISCFSKAFGVMRSFLCSEIFAVKVGQTAQNGRFSRNQVQI
jgi:hypothetical protein